MFCCPCGATVQIPAVPDFSQQMAAEFLAQRRNGHGVSNSPSVVDMSGIHKLVHVLSRVRAALRDMRCTPSYSVCCRAVGRN